MTVSINGTSGLVFNDASTQNTAATGFGFKNRIINGAMQIDQRNAGASVTNIAGRVYPVDRFGAYGDQASKFTAQQSTVAPAGFVNSLLITSSSAYSVGTNEEFSIQHRIEGNNLADLGWGTASAAPVTISFWVRSSLTGTFGGSVCNGSFNRWYPFAYTISAANTWEQKSITIAGDTSGTWLTNNGVGLQLVIGLGVGSGRSGTAGSWSSSTLISATGATSVVGTNGATFYITGVQLEKGSTATSFDYRPYGTELALCQRYYYRISEAQIGSGTSYGIGIFYSSNDLRVIVNLPADMRSTPTIESSSSTNDFRLINSGGSDYFTSITSAGGSFRNIAHLYTASVSGTAGDAGVLISGGTGTSFIGFSSEL
jgi:hypothetical protein